MPASCKFLDKLSADGSWDDVFYCLRIDTNSTIELGGLKALVNSDDSWLDAHKRTKKSLEMFLAVILIFDQIFYVMLLWYFLLFVFKYVRYRVLGHIKRYLHARRQRMAGQHKKSKVDSCAPPSLRNMCEGLEAEKNVVSK